MKRFFKKLIAGFILAGFAGLTLYFFDKQHLGNAIEKLLAHPFVLAGILLLYFLSFCLKAAAWTLYLKGKIRFSTCLIGILYSLFINHLLPVKAGDLVRAKIASIREKELKDEEAFHSVVVLRLLDMLCLIAMTAAGLWALKIPVRLSWGLFATVCFTGLVVSFAVHRYAPAFFHKQSQLLRRAFSGKKGVFIVSCTFLSWILEAGVLYGTVKLIGADLSFLAAVFANSVTIAGQAFQITPGGIGNYESFLVFALTFFQFPLKESYTIAMITHALKFAFSYAAGAIVLLLYPISFQTMQKWIKTRRVREK